MENSWNRSLQRGELSEKLGGRFNELYRQHWLKMAASLFVCYSYQADLPEWFKPALFICSASCLTRAVGVCLHLAVTCSVACSWCTFSESATSAVSQDKYPKLHHFSATLQSEEPTFRRRPGLPQETEPCSRLKAKQGEFEIPE